MCLPTASGLAPVLAKNSTHTPIFTAPFVSNDLTHFNILDLWVLAMAPSGGTLAELGDLLTRVETAVGQIKEKLDVDWYHAILDKVELSDPILTKSLEDSIKSLEKFTVDAETCRSQIASAVAAQEATIREEQAQALEDRQKDLDEQAQRLAEREGKILEREKQWTAREQDMSMKETRMEDREKRWDAREQRLEERERRIEEKDSQRDQLIQDLTKGLAQSESTAKSLTDLTARMAKSELDSSLRSEERPGSPHEEGEYHRLSRSELSRSQPFGTTTQSPPS